MDLKRIKPAVIGLGYVGLPLLIEIGKKYTAYGYDKNHERISDLRQDKDRTAEVTSKELKK